MTVLRSRNAAVTAKLEGTPGTYDAPSGTTDGVLVESPQITFNPQNVQTDEVGGSLDRYAPLVGGMQCEIAFSMYLKGNGTPGVAPEWGKLMKACGFAETLTRTVISGTTFAVADANTITDSGSGMAALTVGTVISVSGFATAANNGEFIVTSSAAGSIDVTKRDGSAAGLTAELAGATVSIAYGVAAVAATAGSTTGATLQSPWSGTAQAYRGMPAILSGNPATPLEVVISDYTSGRVATLADLLGSAADTSTVASIPANVMYKPQSGAVPSASMDIYMDGVVYKFLGCVGNAQLEAAAGGAWKVNFRFMGLFSAKADAAVATPSYDGTRPGVYRGSIFSIDRTAVGMGTLSIDLGNEMAFPPNPNGTEGFDPPLITRRAISGSVDPNAVLVATRDTLSLMRAGTSALMHARLRGGQAATRGNRVGVVVPTAFWTGFKPADRNQIAAEQLNFFCDGQDAGLFLAVW